MQNRPLSEITGVNQGFIMSLGERYTLSSRWIVRSDPSFHIPYSAFNIDSGDKFQISGTLFIILKVLQNNCLTIEQVSRYLHDKGTKLQAAEILKFFANELGTHNVLTISENVLSSHITKRHPSSIKSYVPITSTPLEAEVHLTKACNLRCRHCVYDAGRRIPKELDLESWYRLFDELEGLETCRVIISGGEPLVYPRARILIEYLTSKRVRIELLTNGTLIDESFASLLSAPNFSTNVSLDGADSETHDLLRGHGCFYRVIRGLKFLSQTGACFHITTTVHKRNIHQIRHLVETAIGLGAQSINFILLDPLGRAKDQNDLLLKPYDIVDIGHTVKSLASEHAHNIFVGYLDPSVPNYRDIDTTKSNSHIFCTAGTTRIAIRSDGVIFPCVYAFHDSKYEMGSTRLQAVEDIWVSNTWALFRGSIGLEDLGACKNCSLSEHCALKICRLRAYYDNGDFFGQPPGCHKMIEPMAAKGGDRHARKGRETSKTGGVPSN